MTISAIGLRVKAWTLIGLGLPILLMAMPASAQQGPPRELPAAANPPAQVVEEDRQLRQRVPNPPAKGKAAPGRRPLPATRQPPSNEQALEAELNRKVPNPPGRANKRQLEQRIRSLPGGNERADKARSGNPPGATRGNKPDQGARLSDQSSTDQLLARLGSFFIRDASAQTTLSFDLTPPTNWRAANNSRAILYNAYVTQGYPNNSYAYMGSYNWSYLGGQSQKPIVRLHLVVPADGWYIVNINILNYATNTLSIRHYEGGSYVVIATFPMLKSAYADYPILEYLSAGTHYFYFTTNQYMYLSRISVESYP